MGRSVAEPLKDPHEILLTKARTYAYRGKYLQVIVFSKYLTEIDLLERTFGGHHYVHGTGFNWLLSKREDLVRIVSQVEDRLPSENGFESPILEFYMAE